MSFLTNHNQESGFQQVGGLVKYSCFLFLASRALLQSHAGFNRLLYKGFLTCYSCSYYSSMVKIILFFLLLYSGWAFSGLLTDGGEAKSPLSLKSVTYILQQRNLAQLYLTQRRSKKYRNHVTHHLSSVDISIFSLQIIKFCYIKKCKYRLYFGT